MTGLRGCGCLSGVRLDRQRRWRTRTCCEWAVVGADCSGSSWISSEHDGACMGGDRARASVRHAPGSSAEKGVPGVYGVQFRISLFSGLCRAREGDIVQTGQPFSFRSGALFASRLLASFCSCHCESAVHVFPPLDLICLLDGKDGYNPGACPDRLRISSSLREAGGMTAAREAVR
jgi:hypothetical protein